MAENDRLSPEFRVWLEANHSADVKRLALEAAKILGAGTTTEECWYFLDQAFQSCPPDGKDLLYANDIKDRERRFNIAPKWKLRDMVQERQRPGQRFRDNNYWQLGTRTHEAVRMVLMEEVPQPSLLYPQLIDFQFWKELDLHLKYPDSLPVKNLHQLLHRFYGPVAAPLGKFTGEKEAAASEFMRAWGHAASKLNFQEKPTLFPEVVLSPVALEEEGRKINPGIVDGLVVARVDGRTPNDEDNNKLKALAVRRFRTLDEIIHVISQAEYFSRKKFRFEILEIKTPGEKTLGLLERKEVPRPQDIDQVDRYASLADKAFKERGLPFSVSSGNILYVLADGVYSYRFPISQERMANYLDNLRSNLSVFEQRARLRQMERYMLDFLIKELEQKGAYQPKLF